MQDMGKRDRDMLLALFSDRALPSPPAHTRPQPPTAAATATELMNRIYRRQRHIYDVSRKWFLLGRDRLIEDLRPGAGAAVLEIGCGTGRNLIVAAQRYPNAQFFGIDVSTNMLTSAIEAIGQAGLSSRVRVAHADATAFDPLALFGRPRFERIMISYSLSMIPGWHAALDVALSLLASGGRLQVADFGGQEGLPGWFRTLLRAWLAHFHVTPRDTLEARLSSLTVCTGAKLVIERPYRGYVQYALVEATG
jgi:S-adenosylmethionine-diacylgycerolhomoserine-N-methlytransferase